MRHCLLLLILAAPLTAGCSLARNGGLRLDPSPALERLLERAGPLVNHLASGPDWSEIAKFVALPAVGAGLAYRRGRAP